MPCGQSIFHFNVARKEACGLFVNREEPRNWKGVCGKGSMLSHKNVSIAVS